MKSKITEKKEINYEKEFIVNKLFADPKIIEMHKKRLEKLLPKDTSEEEIKKRIHSMVVKENAFNTIMEYISKQYEYSIDKDELEDIGSKIATQFKIDANTDKNKIKAISEKIIIKSLIFKSVAEQKNISVTDDEAKEYLNKYYRETNQPINELLNNEAKFKEIKEIILEEKITEMLLKTFKIKFELEK